MKASKFTDAQRAFVVKQGEEGTPVAEIVYVGPQPNPLEGSSFKGGFGGKGGGANSRTTSPPATVSRYWPSLFEGLLSEDEEVGLFTHTLALKVAFKGKCHLRY